MRQLDLDLDFKHLLVFDEIFKRRSVSEAANALGLSQPSVSLLLSKLREHFQDPLFVRTPSGMQPTPRAKTISAPVTVALNALRRATAQEDAFVPATSRNVFRLSFTDIGQVVILPLLLPRLRQLAPHVSLTVASTAPDTYKKLEGDNLDLAFGSVRKLPPSFFQKTLFKDQFACIASKKHPRIGEHITLERYINERHVVVTSAGTGAWVLESVVDRLPQRRGVVLEIPTFLGLGRIVATTDLIGTVPMRLAKVLAATQTIRILQLPVKIPIYDVKLYWHERQHNNVANKWLRKVVVDLFREPHEDTVSEIAGNG
jgi:DNA-binding transcriptional LysR family regulator